MIVLKKFGIIVFVGIIVLFGLELGERLSIPGVTSLISDVEARVGRPLTPVSVAGVGRRTARRCAADVYDC